jgi:hypothetical protein
MINGNVRLHLPIAKKGNARALVERLPKRMFVRLKVRMCVGKAAFQKSAVEQK